MTNTRGSSALTTSFTPDHKQTAGLARAAHHGGEKSPYRDGEVPLRDLLGDHVLDLLLERSKDGRGGLWLTGEGSMLGELVGVPVVIAENSTDMSPTCTDGVWPAVS